FTGVEARVDVASMRLLLCTLALAAVVGTGLAEALPNGNPANRLAKLPIDDYAYDHATECKKRPQRGTVALQRWLEQNAPGVSWGIMRCEKWGKNSASLHAEGRALDWHLDSRSRRQLRAANRLIDLLLATDKKGNRHALARRMGIQEIIWNCHSWWSGSDGMDKYSKCFNERGKRLKHINFTEAHKDHIHFGLSWRGAKKRTSFWAR
ncbi:MAG: hypothetical protein ACRDJY_07560, partial [Thermoleophilaceae bacterium]